MTTPKRTQPTPDMRPYEERQHPLMWADYAEIPVDSLTLDTATIGFEAPYAVALRFFSTGPGSIQCRAEWRRDRAARSSRIPHTDYWRCLSRRGVLW